MLNKKGFTMIEMVFVLFIIIILSSLTMSFHLPSKKDQTIIQEISYILNQAKLNAMVYKETTTVSFTSKMLSVSSPHYNQDYSLTDHRVFEKYQMTYNESGNIKTAKTVQLHCQNKTYAFVFQVGNGCFYVQ